MWMRNDNIKKDKLYKYILDLLYTKGHQTGAGAGGELLASLIMFLLSLSSFRTQTTNILKIDKEREGGCRVLNTSQNVCIMNLIIENSINNSFEIF